MQLHQLTASHPHKPKRRVGRGGKRGTYSGRGIKGQKARAGRRIRPALRDLLKKIPKQRGYRFRPLKEKPRVLNMDSLEKNFAAGETVSPQTLAEKRIAPTSRGRRAALKILGDGAITKALTVERIPVSQSARAKIEAAGGKIAEETQMTKSK